MNPLSQKEYGELRSLYQQVYASPEVEITEELIDEIVDELVEELVEEGYAEEEAYSLVEEATDTYIDEAKVTFGHDTAARRASGAPVGARRRYGMRKAGEAVKAAKGAASDAYKTAKAKAASAAVDVSLAGSMAKKKAGDVKKAAQEAPGKARAAASEAKKKAKSGIKGFIKRQAEKVVKRMSEETVGEGIDFKGAAREQARRDAIQAEKDKKSPSSKDRRLARGKFRPGASAAERAEGGRDAMREKGTSPTKDGKKMFEELQASGLFSEQELDRIFEQMTTQTQFKPLPSSGSTGVNKPPSAPTLPPASATKPPIKKKPEPKLGAGTPGFGYGVGTGP